MKPTEVELSSNPTPRRRLTIIAVALSISIIILFIQAPPHTLLGKADLVGYAICHRIPERSFLLGDRHFPLCARCTGTFLGALLGLAAMFVLRRGRAAQLPPVPVLAVLAGFIGVWAFDGLNSYLTFFPNAPNLYEPRNWLRMTMGLLNGLALIIFVFPILNFTLWRKPTREPAIKNLWELLALTPMVPLLVLAAQSEISVLVYPLAILSTVGVVVMLVVINSMIIAVVLGREGYARTWQQALIPLVVGMALTILQITAMDLFRVYITAKLGLPF